MQAELFIFISTTIAIVSSACKPSDVGFVGFLQGPKRRLPFNVEVVAIKCPGETEFYYKWEVHEYEKGKLMQSSTESSITIDGYSYPTQGIFNNNFRLSVQLSHYPDMRDSTSISKLFAFRMDKMHIEIRGGSNRTHTLDTDLIVDAKSLSRDPSYPPNENQFPNTVISWVITPDIDINTTTLILVVPKEYLQEGQTMEFRLVIQRASLTDYDYGIARQTVHILAGVFPQIDLLCIRNCIYPHPKETTAMQVVCTRNCEDLFYEWFVEPNVTSSQIDFGNGFDKIILEPNTFQAGQLVTITVITNSAQANYIIHFLRPFTRGFCDISPDEGVSGKTKFRVICDGFYSQFGGITYTVYQKVRWEEPILITEDMTLSEYNVHLTEGRNSEVVVEVHDNTFMKLNLVGYVTVFSFLDGIKSTTTVENATKTLILNDDSDSVASLSVEHHRNRIIQRISFLLDAIQKAKLEDSVVEDLHAHMAEGLNNVLPHNFFSSVQIITILTKFQKKKLPVDTRTSKLIARCLMNSVAFFHNISNHEDQSNIPSVYILDFAKGVIELSSKLLEEIKGFDLGLQSEAASHNYDSYDEMLVDKLKIRTDMRDVTRNAIVTLQIIGTSVLHRAIPNQRATLFETNTMTFASRRLLLPLNQTITLASATDSKVFFPEPLIDELKEKYHDFIDYQFMVFKNDPFWWEKNSSLRNTDSILFDLFKNCSKIKNVKNPFYLHLKTTNVSVGILKGQVNNSHEDIVAHRITLNPHAKLLLVFQPTHESFKVKVSDCFCRKKDFSDSIEIGPESGEKQRTLFIPPIEGKDEIYICIMRLTESTLEYEGKFSSFSCVYWNLKTEKWNSDGCRVKEASLTNGSFLVCECSHVSFFSGEIFVPPNSLNFNIDIDFYIMLTQNFLMLIVVASLLLFWLILFIWAWRKDKKIRRQNLICKLDDNIPGDENIYLVVIFTGTFLDAGTTADVALQLIGDLSESRVHVVKCKGTSYLQRNHQDWFIIYTPEPLGKLKKLRLWHNCRGNKPHWYCQRVLVQDLKNGTQFCFIVEKWFSLVWGSGKIYRESTVAQETNLKETKVLFRVKFETHLKDKHLWLSIFTRDAQSNFNCRERVSCGISVLFLSMVASAMFFGIPTRQPQDSIDPHSSHFLSHIQMSIFFESLFVTLPAGVIIITIFRSSAPQKYNSIIK